MGHAVTGLRQPPVFWNSRPGLLDSHDSAGAPTASLRKPHSPLVNSQYDLYEVLFLESIWNATFYNVAGFWYTYLKCII